MYLCNNNLFSLFLQTLSQCTKDSCTYLLAFIHNCRLRYLPITGFRLEADPLMRWWNCQWRQRDMQATRWTAHCIMKWIVDGCVEDSLFSPLYSRFRSLGDNATRKSARNTLTTYWRMESTFWFLSQCYLERALASAVCLLGYSFENGIVLHQSVKSRWKEFIK